MKIVFIIDQMYLHGGIERVLSIKANYFAMKKDYEVHIITSEQKNKKTLYNLNDNIHFEDININYHRLKSYFHPANVLKLPKHIFRIRKKLKRIQPDVVVVCSHGTDTYFMPFILKNIPKVKEFHFSRSIEIPYRNGAGSAKKKYFLKFADYVESKYDKLVVLNPDEATYYKTNNTVTIPNPLTFFPETVSKVQDQIVIAAGRIAPVKRYDSLIDIWELVHAKNETWKLHIYGEGEEHYVKLLKKKIEEKHLSDHVFLMGATNDIQNKMLHSSLFVMTSDNECFPLVLLEAQACGLPIISFDCPHGPRNIITKGNGELIKMSDNNGFSEAVLEMISNPDKRTQMGVQARENATQYSIEKVMDKWSEMFNDVTHKTS